MSSESLIISKKALITLIAASIVVIISLGIRQTFGLFYYDFNTDLDISISHIGLEDPKDLIADLKKALKFIK